MDTAKLYLVPTPIGNLEDMTFRAVNVLKSVQVILTEDTRTSGRLLKHYNIETRMQPYHQFNEHKVVAGLVARIAEGESMALITDAGTPGISDPGFLLVRACVEQGVEVETLPGATAFVPALVNSGLPRDKFYFEGFLPHKKGRQTRLKILAEMTVTLVLYESPHRLEKTLAQLVEFFGADRQVSVSRELTKLFEETRRGTAEALLTHFTEVPAKGEIVMVIEGKKE